MAILSPDLRLPWDFANRKKARSMRSVLTLYVLQAMGHSGDLRMKSGFEGNARYFLALVVILSVRSITPLSL